MTTETLANDVAWEPSGHLSEVALSVMADGEDALLDAAMHAHLTSCEACAVKLGEIALRAADVATAFAEAPSFVADVKSALAAPEVVQATASALPNEIAPAIATKALAAAKVAPPAIVQAAVNDLTNEAAIEPKPLSSRRRFPAVAIAAAMAVALIGALPTIARARQQIAPLWAVLMDVTPALVRLGPKALAKMWSAPASAPMLPVVWALAVVLVAAGLAIASRASKKMLVQGGRR